MNMREALVRVARFHLKLALGDYGGTVGDPADMLHSVERALLCLERADKPADHTCNTVQATIHDSVYVPLLDVCIRNDRIYFCDMQAESAPWVYLAEDLSVEEVGTPDEHEP